METKEYTNPKEAYDIMNQWTRIKTSYETKFHRKNVTKVDLMFEGNQPRFATVHFRSGTDLGFEVIDLSQKMLLNKPEKQTIVDKVQGK